MDTADLTRCYMQGVAWGPAEKKEWFEQQTIKRSYHDEVLSKLDAFKGDFDVVQYGKLTLSVNDYPLFAVKTREWDNSKQTILVTGGVHGYETSGVQVCHRTKVHHVGCILCDNVCVPFYSVWCGVQGALRFIQTKMKAYEATFNCVVCPCVCPW